MIGPINSKLSSDNFIDSSLEKLCGEGIKYKVSDTEVAVPYDGAGIYVFWASLDQTNKNNVNFIKKLLVDFLDKWDEPVEEIKYFPKSNKTRMKKTLESFESGNMIPFYLGKSKNVSKRIEQHLYLEPHKKTYSLKLSSRTQLLENVDFEITWLPLGVKSSEYFLVSRIEALLREHLNPIIGKQ